MLMRSSDSPLSSLSGAPTRWRNWEMMARSVILPMADKAGMVSESRPNTKAAINNPMKKVIKRRKGDLGGFGGTGA